MYDKPDAGLWEFRTRNGPYLQRGNVLGGVRPARQCRRPRSALSDRASFWRERADTMRGTIEKQAWREDERGFAATFGGDELDASLLQLLDMRFLEPDDPRFLATFEAVEKGPAPRLAHAALCRRG